MTVQHETVAQCAARNSLMKCLSRRDLEYLAENPNVSLWGLEHLRSVVRSNWPTDRLRDLLLTRMEVASEGKASVSV